MMHLSVFKILTGILLVGFALMSGAWVKPAFGDLGALVARGEIGDQRITVLAAPSPLRVGTVLLSLSLQPTKNSARPEVTEIDLTFTPPDTDHLENGHGHGHHGAIRARARPEGSPHPGMLATQVDLQKAGTWTVQAALHQSDREERFSFDLEVGPPASPWLDYGLAFAFPLVGILIFIWHQRRRLIHRRKDVDSA